MHVTTSIPLQFFHAPLLLNNSIYVVAAGYNVRDFSPYHNSNKHVLSAEYGRYQRKIDIIVKQGLTKSMIALVLGGALIFIIIVLLVSYFSAQGQEFFLDKY